MKNNILIESNRTLLLFYKNIYRAPQIFFINNEEIAEVRVSKNESEFGRMIENTEEEKKKKITSQKIHQDVIVNSFNDKARNGHKSH